MAIPRLTRTHIISLAILLGTASLLAAGARESSDRNIPAKAAAWTLSGTAQAPASFAILDVTVIPMDRQRVLPNQTVVVREGRIVSVGPASRVSVPGDAVRIDGRGKYLVPGLAEMHAHVQGPQAPNSEELNRDIMFLYVANGITTIRAMLGAPNQLVLREKLTRGEVVGPAMYVAAPSLNGQTAPDPVVAEKLVRAHKQAGYDLLKIHPGLNSPAYDAIVRTARDVGITWAGHVSSQIGIERILETRQSTVDHLDGYIEGAASDEMKRRMISGDRAVSLPEMWRSVTDARMRDLARRTRLAGVWNVPTMFLWESFSAAGSPEEWARRGEMKYAPKQWVDNWINQKQSRIQSDARNGVSAADAVLHIQLRRRMLKALADEGALLLMGTDSPQMFNVPGFALHRELQVAIEAGLTPFQVLESGTKNVGLYVARDLKQDGRFGTVTAGSRADLVLLNANPLQSIANLADRAGVMARGRWLSRADIDAGLAALAGRYAR